MRRSVFLGVTAALLYAGRATAGSYGSGGIGTTAGEFLQLGAGARASAMGEAYSAAVEDADAMYWNPAALTNIDHKSATLMHVPYLVGASYDYAAYAQSLGTYGAYGVGLQYFSAGSIAQTDQTGTPLGSYTPNDLALALGYAYKLDVGFSIGGDLKIIRSTVLNSAQTTALDLGLLSPAYYHRKLRWAFTLANIGPGLNYGNGASEPLPQTARLGVSYRVNKKWLATSDLVLPRNNQSYLNLGTEYWLYRDTRWGAAGRLGYNSLTSSGLEGFSGLSVGVGIRWQKWILDYAMVPYGSLGLTHRISLTVRWNKITLPHLSLPSIPILSTFFSTETVTTPATSSSGTAILSPAGFGRVMSPDAFATQQMPTTLRTATPGAQTPYALPATNKATPNAPEATSDNAAALGIPTTSKIPATYPVPSAPIPSVPSPAAFDATNSARSSAGTPKANAPTELPPPGMEPLPPAPTAKPAVPQPTPGSPATNSSAATDSSTMPNTGDAPNSGPPASSPNPVAPAQGQPPSSDQPQSKPGDWRGHAGGGWGP